jgi:molybdenum cofactor cytidylyltransferase
MPAEGADRVAGVVLAAGASTRMGRNKLLLPLDGETLLRRVVRGAAAAGLDPLLVVLGHDAEQAAAELAGLSCLTVVNTGDPDGIRGSVRTGIAALPASTPAVVVLLADMPFVSPSMIEKLIQRYRETGAPLVTSEYGGVDAPPRLYDHALFRELVDGENPGCQKSVVGRHRHEAVTLRWPAESLADLDAPADYERAVARLAAG